jgi:hypothetical protein
MERGGVVVRLLRGRLAGAQEMTMRRLLLPLMVVVAGALYAQESDGGRVGAVVSAPASVINLARTSVAAVNASGVNGKRPLDNAYYGVTKAFDDGGKAEPDGINYNYWLADAGDTRPWVEVHFDVPVEIHDVVVLGGPAYRAEFKWKGDYEFVGKAEGALKPDKPSKGVTAVRVTFEARESPVRVDEIRILGNAPAEARVMVQDPRILINSKSAEAAAHDAFEAWKAALFSDVMAERTETAEAVVITYRQGGMDLARATIRKADGKTSFEPLTALTATSKR